MYQMPQKNVISHNFEMASSAPANLNTYQPYLYRPASESNTILSLISESGEDYNNIDDDSQQEIFDME